MNSSFPRPPPILSAAALLFAAGFTLANPASAGPERPLRFNRDIRPILSDNCFRCHGPELKSRKAKLRLDVREVALKKEAIIPGDPGFSEMIFRLESDDPEERMPPPDTHKVVTPAQMATLKRWIADGAAYEPHWSYTPIERPELPVVADAGPDASAIDRFVLARLEQENVEPAPPADRRTLLRRLALDLTGLPPTIADMEQFLNNRSPDAYDREVERLLASPHYGERMAVPWLDAVRFADTVGYHGDQNQNIFPYRDYVIDSFNENKPFDEFTIEQIAADLLPEPTVEQRVATGFNRLNMMTREGGAQPKEYLAKYAADRVRTVSTAWLGSTMACAECHDHKFDPFTTRDFYSLAAFFDDVKQWGVYSDYKYTPNPELKGWDNDHPFPPEIMVTSPYLERREARLSEQLEELIRTESTRLSGGRETAFAAWRNALEKFLAHSPDGWRTAREPKAKVTSEDSETTLSVEPDGRVVASGCQTKGDRFEISIAPAAGWVAAIRLELLPHPNHADTWLREAEDHGAAEQIRFSAELITGEDEARPVEFHHSDASTKIPRFSNGHEIHGVEGIWKLDTAAAGEAQRAVYLLETPIRLARSESLKVTVGSDKVGCFRIATSPLAAANPLESGAPPEFLAALHKPSWLRSREEKELLATTWLRSTTDSPEAQARLVQLERDIRDCRGGVTPTLVTVATPDPLVTRVLPRGDWQDESGPIVAPAVPRFLPQPKTVQTGELTRLDLARWLVSPENPLTARAFVNRLWKQFLGHGISNQPEDLGAQGESPTHPELLDWLAAEFIESGWNVKHMVRLIVTSDTYRQDSTIRPELLDTDPDNRLLARQNPRRLEAEFVRDNALAIAGLLGTEIGGPSGFPYQPANYYTNLQFPDRDYTASHDERQYRRGLYTHWQRTFLHPMLANFDAPSREECTVDRPHSTTPQQALTLLNDPSFVEAARALAEKLLRAPRAGSDEARVKLAVETALLRPAKPAETKSLLEFLGAQREHYLANEAAAQALLSTGIRPPAGDLPPAEHAAWTSLARVILNLHETITRY